MIKKLKLLLTASAFALVAFAPVAVVGTANAQIQESLCSGVQLGDPSSGAACDTNASTTGVQSAVENIVDLLSWVVGVISVIMIIVGGFRYITSGGASDKVTGAKNTIIYAVIGLVIVALAQFIVNFVIGKAITIDG